MTRAIRAFEPQDVAERWIEEFDASKRAVPASWTPEYVGLRLIEGFQTLRKLPSGKTLPKAFGNGWPAIVRSWADAVGAEPTRDATKFSFERAETGEAMAAEVTRLVEARL